MPKSTKTREAFDFGEITSTYYWIHWSEFTDDGTFVIKTSDYSADWHMTGMAHIKPDASDYPLWQWLVKRRADGILKSDIISNSDLDSFRAEFKASAT